jgi:hypothetical protein
VRAVNNKDLKEAYDALWGRSALASDCGAEAGTATDANRAQGARSGPIGAATLSPWHAPKIIVDLQRVRLTGKDKGSSNVRNSSLIRRFRPCPTVCTIQCCTSISFRSSLHGR